MNIGDKINTEEVGDATVTDVFISPTSNKKVVELQDTLGSLYCFIESELTLVNE